MTKRRVWAASYERGVELAAAGCPLDYLDALRNDWAAARNPFWVKQLAGYAESCAYVLSDSLTAYVIGLRLGTNRGSGTEIAQWNFAPPWPEHNICWDYEPADIIPKLDLGSYRDVLDSRLPEILKDHFLLRRGRPVAGLLCGVCNQPVPESREGLTSGKLSLTDDNGQIVSVRVDLRICRTAAIRSGKSLQPRLGPLLDKSDQIPVGSNAWSAVPGRS
jgi:hypothetical protein